MGRETLTIDQNGLNIFKTGIPCPDSCVTRLMPEDSGL
jgi:hypothetical protein